MKITTHSGSLTIKRSVLVVWCLALIAFAFADLFFAAKKATAANVGSQTGESELTEQERRGKNFYLRGATASGEEAIAVLNEIEVPASTVTCAGCHGADGLGKKEGGIVAGNLTWEHLTKSYGHTHDGNRQHAAFTEASFVRAVSAGVDPAGNSLAVVMPRYRMQASDMADLIAYIKRIQNDRDPGLSDASIVIGTILPSAGARAEIGQAMGDVLAAFFYEINNRGGIYNRRVELKVLDANFPNDAAKVAGCGAIEEEKIFALVSGLDDGCDDNLFKTVNAKAIPLVGLSTPYTQPETPLNRYVFYLHSGLEDQARALVNFAAQEPESTRGNAVIIHPQTEASTAIARGVQEQAKKNKWNEVSLSSYPGQKFDAERLARELKQRGTNKIFFFGASGQDKLLVEQLAAVKYYPTVFLLGTLAGKDLLNAVPIEFADKIYLAYPSMPSDLTAKGFAEYRALVEKHKIKVGHTTAQIAALAAAKILIEALQRSGRDVSREKLVAELEGLYDFQTAMTQGITYGPNRRKGSAGAYLVKIDPKHKTFVPASNWIKAT